MITYFVFRRRTMKSLLKFHPPIAIIFFPKSKAPLTPVGRNPKLRREKLSLSLFTTTLLCKNMLLQTYISGKCIVRSSQLVQRPFRLFFCPGFNQLGYWYRRAWNVGNHGMHITWCTTNEFHEIDLISANLLYISFTSRDVK